MKSKRMYVKNWYCTHKVCRVVFHPSQDAGGQSGDEVFEESDEEGGERINLEALSKDQHPCLAEGSFSIFNSPQVHPATVDDVIYNMDLSMIIYTFLLYIFTHISLSIQVSVDF